MRFTVVTLFPEMFESVLAGSILGKARAAGLIEVAFVDPREFTSDRHRTVDDAPYGGGPGMVMKPEPLLAALEAAAERGAERGWPAPHRMLMSPVGAALTQDRVRALAEKPHLLMVCGRYEGIDERVAELAIDEEVSLGDFVMTGGELAAMAIIDAVSRYVPGVLGESASTAEESFSQPLLEYPQYTRPAEFRGLAVPDILLSGDHAKVATWRRQMALRRTAERRPDLIARSVLGRADRKLLRASGALWSERCYVILAHHPVTDHTGAVVTSSITNLDVHDIARSVTTYGLGAVIVVTPIDAQRDKVDRMTATWREGGFGDDRERALDTVLTAASIEDAVRAVSERHGEAAVVVATSASPPPGVPLCGPAQLARERAGDSRPTCLLFGTGWGLTPEALAGAERMLTPLQGHTDFNHLSVRSAVAIVLDRLFGAGGEAEAGPDAETGAGAPIRP